MTNPLTNAGVGRALFTTRFTLSLQAVKMSLFAGALPGLVLPYVLWVTLASRQNVELVRLNAVSHFLSEDSPTRWRMTGADGERKIVEAVLSDGRYVQWLKPEQVRTILAAPLNQAMWVFRMVEALSMLGAIFGFGAMTLWLRRLGRDSQKDTRIRGAYDVATPQALSSAVRAVGGGVYSLAGVAIPKDAPMRGILSLGSQGSGKSVAIHDLMRQCMAKGRKCVIYDQSGEFMSAYFRPGKDRFFNPALEGSIPWSIFEEIKYSYDGDTMARAFLPPKAGVVSGGSGFFEDAARALFSVILSRLKARGAHATRDIARAFLEMPESEMEHLIARSVASSAVGGDSKGQRQGVISSIAIYLNGIAAVQPGRWSVREFLEEPCDGRLFILGTADTRTMFAPLFRLLLTVLFSAIEAKQEVVHEDRYWFFLDEVHTLGDIRLDEVLATLRKFGVCVVSGIQSDTQFVQSMGTERAATVTNCFNTSLVLSCNEAGLQERCAKLLGKQELDTVSRNQALANNETRDGAALNRSDAEKWLIMPSDLGSRDPCTGWIKFSGSFPVAEVDYRSWLKPTWWGRPAIVDLGKPVNPLPKRDPNFLVGVNDSGDPFDQVRQEVQEAKKASQNDVPPSPYGVPGAAGAAGAAVAERPPSGARPELGTIINRARDSSAAAASTPASGASAGANSGERGGFALRPDHAVPSFKAIDSTTGEILAEVGRPRDKAASIARQMDPMTPGQGLGYDISDQR